MIPTLRIATQNDLEVVRDILETSQLSAHGILEPNTTYWLAEINDPAGCIGLEWGARAALLRSAAVLPDHRGNGIGTRLLETALNGARDRQKRFVYLFSTDAGEYWTHQGFQEYPFPNSSRHYRTYRKSITTETSAGCPPKSLGGSRSHDSKFTQRHK
jgi:N-acetylglutamate synthase-like GNAT family acetyltransferase